MLEVRYTPLKVPAITFVPSLTIEYTVKTGSIPLLLLLTRDHVAPVLVERKTPRSVPAKIFVVPSALRLWTLRFVNPVVEGFHVVPPLSE